MIVALIDNGSLEPEAHRVLRSVAAQVSARAGMAVEAVSWKHSDRIPPSRLEPTAWTLARWYRRRHAEGKRDFLFVPFFLSTQGAIASALRRDLARLEAELGPARVRFSPGLADTGALAPILADRVRSAAAALGLRQPRVLLVDHGGPSRASAALRDAAAAALRAELGAEASIVAAASMESPAGDEFAFNRPLFAEQLGRGAFAGGPVLAAPLFLSPGRHAGPDGDLARLARAAEAAHPGLSVHFTELVGTHPRTSEALGDALKSFLSLPSFHEHTHRESGQAAA